MEGSGNIKKSIEEAEAYNPQCEDFAIFWADDMTHIKAKDCRGNIIPFFAGAGVDLSIFTDDGNLDEDRLFGGDGFSLTMSNFSAWSFETAGNVGIEADATDISFISDNHIFENKIGQIMFDIDNQGKALAFANVISWFNDTVDVTKGGVSVNLVNGWGTSGFKNDIIVFPHVNSRGVDARFHVPNNQVGQIYLGSSSSSFASGMWLEYDNTPVGGPNNSISSITSHGDMILKTLANTGDRKISISPRNIGNGLEVRQQQGGANLTDFLLVGLRVYTSVALAQADATLPIDALYMVTTEVFGLSDNTVKIKV